MHSLPVFIYVEISTLSFGPQEVHSLKTQFSQGGFTKYNKIYAQIKYTIINFKKLKRTRIKIQFKLLNFKSQ